MRAVRNKNTTPELRIRSLVHSLGYRYLLHVGSLPGKPDLVFPGRQKVIFVHGCFWHKHRCRHGKISPTTNTDYWNDKRNRNAQRDQTQIRALRASGWQVLVVWECELRQGELLRMKLDSFLGSPHMEPHPSSTSTKKDGHNTNSNRSKTPKPRSASAPSGWSSRRKI